MLSAQSKLLLLNFLICFPLIGCSVISDQNVDPGKNNQAAFRKDLRECKEDYPETGSGVHIRQWQGCMQLKGWK